MDDRNMDDFRLDLQSLHEAYERGLTPDAMVENVYARIAAAEDTGIFLALRDKADVLRDARALGARDATKPLWGVPFAIKDNIDLAGLPTTAGCPDFAFTPTRSAHVCERLIAAGAIPIGKTNLDQFATGLVGVRTPYPPPRNAIDAAVVPGGSSSGSAVAVARGLVSFALGTDTAGSGRVPAGLNNIVGLKPTLGAVSTRGVLPACRTLDCVSVFALTVDDAYAAFSAANGFDPADAYARPVAADTIGPLPPALRIAIPDAHSLVFGGDAQAQAAFEAAVMELRALGAAIVEVDLAPFHETARLLYEGPWVAERYAAIREMIEHSPDSLHPVTRAIIEKARAFSAADAFAAQYRLMELKRATQSLWSSVDALVVPTYPRPRSVADLAADPIGPNSELGTYTNFVNLLDLCALATPTKPRADGFPGSVTFIAPAGHDARIAAMGAALNAQCGVALGATGWRQTAPAPRPTTAKANEIELCVVGAHLSGMALNGELTGRGARFLRAATTRPDYRLFALPGGPPFRPGMLRVAPGAGQAIETEVWALSPQAFGDFVAHVPAPLCIGTTLLADGSRPKGFVVESEATAGARDISSYGGWRAFAADVAA